MVQNTGHGHDAGRYAAVHLADRKESGVVCSLAGGIRGDLRTARAQERGAPVDRAADRAFFSHEACHIGLRNAVLQGADGGIRSQMGQKTRQNHVVGRLFSHQKDEIVDPFHFFRQDGVTLLRKVVLVTDDGAAVV